MSAEQTGAFFALVSVCSGLGSVLSLLLLLAKPVRERLFGLSAIREGQKCMLRADMLAAYYKHREEKTNTFLKKFNDFMLDKISYWNDYNKRLTDKDELTRSIKRYANWFFDGELKAMDKQETKATEWMLMQKLLKLPQVIRK